MKRLVIPSALLLGVFVLSCDEVKAPTEPTTATVDQPETGSIPHFKPGAGKVGYLVQWVKVVKSGGQWTRGNHSGVLGVNHITDTIFSIDWDNENVGLCAITINPEQFLSPSSGFETSWRRIGGPFTTPQYEVANKRLSDGVLTGVWPVVVVRYCTYFNP